jgi:hypothetical protein
MNSRLEHNMLTKQCIALLLSFAFLSQGTGLADEVTQAIKQKHGLLAWSELEALVVDRTAKTTLADGARIEGDILAVRPEALVIDIRKTSDKTGHPKGEAAIPRGLVTGLQLIRHSGPGRLIGGLLGAVGGCALAGVITFYNPGAGAILGWTVLLPGAATGGYYFGKTLDRRVTKITIAPENSELAQEVQP